MTRRKPLHRMAALLLCVFLCLGAAFSMMGAAYAAEVEPSGIKVEITKPPNRTSGSADVGYCITDTAGNGFASAKIKVGLDGEWQDVTGNLERWEDRYTGRITITDNCPVTIRVTGNDGSIYEKMCYMDCFAQGTHIFMTNVMVDNPAVKGDGGKADKAPSPNQAETNTATKPTATPLKAPASSSTDPQEKPDTTPRLPTALTPDGQGTVVDNVTDQDSKEFFTFTTPSNNTFYLVIDKQRDSENVYFLNAVTESDLLALAEKDKKPEGNNVSAIPDPEPVCTCKDKCAPGEVNTDCPVCVLTMMDCTGKAPAVDPDTDQEPEKPEKGGSSTMILVVIAALAVGGAGYYLKIWKPKHDLDDAEDFDELTGGDEETVNEDDLDPTPRRVPRDEPEEPDYPEGYGYEEPGDEE